MKLPQVTLIGEEGEDTFVLSVGKRQFLFVAGKTKSVPIRVAVSAKKKILPNGSPKFDIKNMPSFIVNDGGQNVGGKDFQRKFKEWP